MLKKTLLIFIIISIVKIDTSDIYFVNTEQTLLYFIISTCFYCYMLYIATCFMFLL